MLAFSSSVAADLKGRLLTPLPCFRMNALWACETSRLSSSSAPPSRGVSALDSKQKWSSFPASDQIEALGRRMDQLGVGWEGGGFGLDGGVHRHPFEIARPSRATRRFAGHAQRDFGHHAALSDWPRATTASIPLLNRIVRGTHSTATLRAQWMTSQVIAICWEGALTAGHDEQHLKKKDPPELERK
jgi:hypothetical protein